MFSSVTGDSHRRLGPPPILANFVPAPPIYCAAKILVVASLTREALSIDKIEKGKKNTVVARRRHAGRRCRARNAEEAMLFQSRLDRFAFRFGVATCLYVSRILCFSSPLRRGRHNWSGGKGMCRIFGKVSMRMTKENFRSCLPSNESGVFHSLLFHSSCEQIDNMATVIGGSYQR